MNRTVPAVEAEDQAERLRQTGQLVRELHEVVDRYEDLGVVMSALSSLVSRTLWESELSARNGGGPPTTRDELIATLVDVVQIGLRTIDAMTGPGTEERSN